MEDKRKRRTNNEIEDRLNKALIQIVEEVGFQGVTLRAIIRKVKIEPAVFYKRYDDLNAFIDELVRKCDYWFSDVAKGCKDAKDDKELYISILNNLFCSLKENKLMQQLLKWELSENNDITRRTARLREFHTLPLVDRYKEIFAGTSVEIDTVSALIIGGLYYLVLHADLSPFGGIDINSESGGKKISDAIEYFGNVFFAEKSADCKMREMAKKMLKDGMDINAIARYTELSVDVIRKLD